METRADLDDYSAFLFKLQFFKATLLRFTKEASITIFMDQDIRFERAISAWKAEVLPLH